MQINALAVRALSLAASEPVDSGEPWRHVSHSFLPLAGE